MTLKKDLNVERDRVFEGLRDVWGELEAVREKWIENPLSQELTNQLKKQEQEASKLEEKFHKVYQRLYGSWVGIEE